MQDFWKSHDIPNKGRWIQNEPDLPFLSALNAYMMVGEVRENNIDMKKTIDTLPLPSLSNEPMVTTKLIVR